MTEQGRNLLHEAMEQQTISITKSNLQATLNARVSILAAGNPCFGKYNRMRSIESNLNLPSSITSRFDFVWIIQDISNQEEDKSLANHICQFHMSSEYNADENHQGRREVSFFTFHTDTF